MKEYKVEVNTTFLVDGQSDTMQVICPAEYEYSSELSVIRFDEYTDDGCVHTVIEAAAADEVRIMRRGGMLDLYLSEGKTVSSKYESPYGFIMIDYTAVSVKTDLNAQGGELDLLYTLDIGGTFSENRVFVKITRVA